MSCSIVPGVLVLLMLAPLSLAWAQSLEAPPATGVSEALAQERSSTLRDIHYELAFTIPYERSEPVPGRAIVSFTLEAPHRVVFDFEQPREQVTVVRANGRETSAAFENGHVTVPASATVAGRNEIELQFVAGEEALNRSDDFLYTLFVPARARYAFPAFDQPDIKARYLLTLSIPDGWQVVANAPETLQREMIRGRAPNVWFDMVRFAETEPLPTYLVSFAVGKFSIETATRNGRTFRMFHRETDAAKVARNRDAIFDLHASALAWLEDYTAIEYPFGKLDFVLIPSFQFGGMEHAGATLYNAASLMLDESATQNQLLERASLIAHETSHMWFGDLVTMRWFNDVWMKEVFANFMAAKIVNPSFPQVNHELRFLLSHYPTAYGVDRTEGANPIRQPLANLTEAGQLYGPIIYQKAPVVMRQLELIMGETAFRDGLREYLKTYSFGNATWLDLIGILDRRSDADLAAWSREWVEERGRPSFQSSTSLDAQGRIAAIQLSVTDAMGRGLVWPQRLRVALGYADGVRELPVYVDRQTVSVPGVATQARPLFVLPNGGGLGYGLFILDDDSRRYLLEHVEDITDPLTRGSAWVTLWDNLLEGKVAPDALFSTIVRAIPRESDEQNTQRVLAYLVRLFWRHLPADTRTAQAAAVEATLRAGLGAATSQSLKAVWFNAYRDTALTPAGVAWLRRVWARQERVPGLTLAETDEITMAMELAVRGVDGWQAVLQSQLDRTQNPDRKARFAFVMPALSADPAVRDAAFERFRAVDNRRREPWVLESLSYLNHPLRQPQAVKYVGPALDLLREIQRTGDIFFPTRWMDSTLWGHRSAATAQQVRQFLADHQEYPERLRWTILSTSDELFRVARYER